MQRGTLFTRDYLESGIKETSAWGLLSDNDIDKFASAARSLLGAFPHARNPNESQTEDDFIWPVLSELGWAENLRQQPLSATGKEHVPDGLLFASAEAKNRANARKLNHERYHDGLAIVESKRWNRLLDRREGSKSEAEVPSTQMLRYLRRVEDLTEGSIRWGILTNGRLWRLYFQGARSVSEDFLEIDLAAILNISPYGDDMDASLSHFGNSHWLRVFVLLFRRVAFLPQEPERRTFHQISLIEGRFYEKRVAQDLSDVVFERIFPDLAGAIMAHDPIGPPAPTPAYLDEVKEAALVLLYRLLFVLFAEDRHLLPVDDPRYDDYGLRRRVREDIAARIDERDVFSDTRTDYWHFASELFDGIARGDKSIRLPPYNGGLFDAARAPLLGRVSLPDAVFAPIIDGLGRVDEPGKGRRYVNYRDLSVHQLGSIYERLLEYELVAEDGRFEVRLNLFARKGSGSYYTPDELVRLIIEQTVGPLVEERMARFTARAEELKSDPRTSPHISQERGASRGRYGDRQGKARSAMWCIGQAA